MKKEGERMTFCLNEDRKYLKLVAREFPILKNIIYCELEFIGRYSRIKQRKLLKFIAEKYYHNEYRDKLEEILRK